MIKKYVILLVSTLFLAACSNDGNEIQEAPSVPEPIMLGTSMQMLTTRSNSQTLQATELASGATVGVYIYHNGETAPNATTSFGYANINYTVSGTVGDLALVTSTDQPYFPEDKSKTLDIYAFSPRVYTGTANLSTLTAQDVFTTKADQTAEADYNASDFVWGVKTGVTFTDASSTTSKVEIPLKHKLSKINVTIAPGNGMTLAKLHGARIKLNGVKLDGTVDFTTGAVVERADDTSTSYTNTPSSVILTSAADQTATASFTEATVNYTGATSSAIIIPQTIAASNTFITIELWDGTNYTTAYNVKTTSSVTFAAETVYTYNIIVNASGLSLTTSISDWTPGTTTTGTAE